MTSRSFIDAKLRPVRWRSSNNPPTVAGVDLTVDRVRHLPVLLAITFRPEFQPPWSGRSHVTSLALNRLGERDGVPLVQNLAGNARSTPRSSPRLSSAPTGCRSLSRELTKAVLESAEQGDRVAAVLATTSLAALSVPAARHARSADRRPRRSRKSARCSGREFAYELIEPVAQRHASGKLV